MKQSDRARWDTRGKDHPNESLHVVSHLAETTVKSAFTLISFNGFWAPKNFDRFVILYLTTCYIPAFHMNISLSSGSNRAAVSVGLSVVAARHSLWVTKAAVTIITCRTPSRNALPCVARGFGLQVIGWWLLPAVKPFPFEPYYGTGAAISQCCFSCKKTTSRRSCCTLLCGNSSPRQTLLANPWSLSKPCRSQAVPWYEPQPVPKGSFAAQGTRDPVTQIKSGDLWVFIQL